MVDVRHPWMVAWLVLVWVEISISPCFLTTMRKMKAGKIYLETKASCDLSSFFLISTTEINKDDGHDQIRNFGGSPQS